MKGCLSWSAHLCYVPDTAARAGWVDNRARHAINLAEYTHEHTPLAQRCKHAETCCGRLMQEYYLMALSQPRSETKIDDAAAANKSIYRDTTQDEVSDTVPGHTQDVEHNPHTRTEEDEPLKMWRTTSTPPEFQGRSTSSFINRLVRAGPLPGHRVALTSLCAVVLRATCSELCIQ